MDTDTIRSNIYDLWPYNLAAQVFNIKPNDDTIFRVHAPGVIRAMNERLNEREKTALEYRYIEKMTFEECGKQLGVSRSRARQIINYAEHKLKHPACSRYMLLKTCDDYQELLKERDVLKLENITLRNRLSIKPFEPVTRNHKAAMPVEDMELSVRSYWCLKRAGINTIEDLQGKTYEYLMKVRNLGRKSLEEIVTRAREFGVEIKHENQSD